MAETVHFHRLAQPLEHRRGVGGGCARHDNDEFLAAVAGDDVHFAGGAAKQRRHAAQNFVAHLMAMGVVEPFEVVDVAEDDGVRLPLPFELGVPPRQLVVERPPIRQAGQGVGAGFDGVGFDESGLRLNFFFGVFQLSFHLLVGRQQFGHGGDDGRRFAAVAGRQLLVDFLHAAAVLADVRGDLHRQTVELRHRFMGAALLVAFALRQRRRRRWTAQPPASQRAAQRHHETEECVNQYQGHERQRAEASVSCCGSAAETVVMSRSARGRTPSPSHSQT